MNDWNGYVPYHIAKQRLVARLLNVTDGEIAMWVSGVDLGHSLNAYTIKKFSEPSLFIYAPHDFINDNDYIRPLRRLHFLPDDLEQFQPANRYISRLTLIERWTNFCGNKDQAIDFIQDMANELRLPEYHPIVGVVDSAGHVNGLFNLGQVHEIEQMYFPEPEAEAVVDDNEASTANSSAGTKKFVHPETIEWHANARKIGVEWMESQRKAGKDPGIIEIAKHVFSTEKIIGVRGKPICFETIKREALTGITGKKANGKR